MIFAFVILLGGLWAWNDSIDQEILHTRNRIKQVKAKIKDLSKDDFEFVWDKLYTSYINDLNEEDTFEIISERILKSNLIISIPH